MTLASNPLVLERVALLRARWTRNTSDPVEGLFGVAVIVVVLGLGCLMLERLVIAYQALTLSFLVRHGLLSLAAAFLAEFIGSRAASIQQLVRWRTGWLAPYLLRQHCRHALAFTLIQRAAWQATSVITLAALAWRVQPSKVWIVFGLCLMVVLGAATWVGGFSALRWSMPRPTAELPMTRRRPSLSAALLSLRLPRLASWQWAGLRNSWRTPTSALLLAPGLLLIPGGESQIVSLALCGTMMCLAFGLASWSQGMRRLIIAARWLRAQPLTAWQMLAPLLIPPILVVLFAASLGTLLVVLLGLPLAIALLVLSAIMAVTLLHAGCVACWRFEPGRINLFFAVATVLLGGLLEGDPPLTPVVWVAIMMALIRRTGQW